jgi:hypothetical protein
MEKAKVRSVMPKATERIMSVIVSKVRKEIKDMDISKSIKKLLYLDYPLKESVRLAFMVKWNRKNNKRLLTLPLFIHTIHYVKYNEGAMVDVHKVKYVSTNKITQKQFENIEKNKEEGNTQITLDVLLETKNLYKVGRSKLSYCLDNIYNYRKNESIEIETEQIL